MPTPEILRIMSILSVGVRFGFKPFKIFNLGTFGQKVVRPVEKMGRPVDFGMRKITLVSRWFDRSITIHRPVDTFSEEMFLAKKKKI